MKRVTLLISFIFILIFAIPAFATSLQGMKGLLRAPVADTPPEGRYGLNFQVIGGNDNVLSFNYGFRENIEVFVSVDSQNKLANSGVHGGVKLRVFRETKNQPSLSVGLRNKDLFVVASKTMDYKTNIRGHLGIGIGEFDGIYVGVSKLYNPVTISSSDVNLWVPVTNFKAEFIKNEINLGADLLFNQHFVLNIGVVNFKKFTYGIGYSSSF